MDESVQPDWLSCPALDVISIHAYGVGDYSTSSIKTYVSRAQAAGKKLIMEEWYASSYLSTRFVEYAHNVVNKGCMLLQYRE